MLKSVLVASDLSSRSEPAVQRAVQIVEATGAGLTVLHVVEGDLLEDRMREEVRSAEGYLSSQIAGFDLSSKTEIVVTMGHAFHVICEQAQDCKADMIVLGAHRRQFLRDVFTGTTIERVTRTAGRPVLMANAKTAEAWRKVFIATDMSEASGHAACKAHALGLLDNAEVTFVHGYAPITRQMMTHAGIPVERVHEEAEREFQSTRRDLGRFIQGLDLGDLNYNARIIEGVGADAIAGLVEQAKPGLLVIGTRGLSGVKRLFLGSVAQDLMGSLEIDVLAVPPQA
ncbi:universal stress protein [Roseinatronobacter sp. S2]|uniref:universal stress protein n=1 Tax=Roseinatronobacter sp. S2 TaxID=3035471 RepID=UPI0024104A48|nr:universal stress protein [Roseinatronobacter sp. S2]WFE77189.1 universal stress protein [Roseinatronobacter sp. S2]